MYAACPTEDYFRECAGRADIAKATSILKRAGRGQPPVAGDELQQHLVWVSLLRAPTGPPTR